MSVVCTRRRRGTSDARSRPVAQRLSPPWPTLAARAMTRMGRTYQAGDPATRSSTSSAAGVTESHAAWPRLGPAYAELQLGEMTAYLAHLDVIAETLAGDPAAAERAVLDAEAIVSEAGDRRFLSIVHVDHEHAILAQGRHADAAEAIERIETVPAPCDAEWVIKRHAARGPCGRSGRRPRAGGWRRRGRR